MSKKKVERATAKQIIVWEYIIDHVEINGFQPSIQEMAEHFGIDRKALHDRLKELEKKHFIRLPGPNKERCIRLNLVRFKVMYYKPESPQPPQPRTESPLE